MQNFVLEGTLRTQVGRRASKDSRATEMVPCVLYGDGENTNFEVAKTALKTLIYTPNIYRVIIKVDGKETATLMREIQFHKVTDEILHIDFLKLEDNKKVTYSVPIVLEGQSAGVRAGGKLVQRVRKLAVRAFPKDLIDSIPVNISNLEINQTFRVGDVKINNIEVLGSKSIPVVTIAAPRAVKAATEDAKAAPAAAKTEAKA